MAATPDPKQHEAALPVGPELLARTDLVAAMIDVIPHPLFFKDSEGRYLGCNAAFARMLGKTPAEIVGRTVYEVAPTYLAQIYHEADMKLMAEGGSQRYVSSVKFGDGVTRRGIFYKAVFHDGDGRAAGIVGIFYAMEFLLDVLEV